MLGYITDPASPTGLTRKTFEEPRPSRHEALIDVHAYSISHGETHLLRLRPDGFRPGQEFAGVVRRAAEDGAGPPAGTRVIGLTEGGTWSETVAAPAQQLGVLPASVTMEQACALAGSGLMAYRALQCDRDLTGRQVLITGASGAVGNIAVQLALLAGAKTTALVSGQHRVAAVRAFGDVKVVTSLDDTADRFDLVLDGVGGIVLKESIRRLAPDGLVLTYGAVTGEPAPIVPGDFRNAPGSRLQAFFIWLTDNSTFGADLTALAQLVAAGRLKPSVAMTLDWTETAKVVAAIRNREVVGKAVLLVRR